MRLKYVGSEPRPLAISTQGVLVVCGAGSDKERAQRAPLQVSVSANTQWVIDTHWQRTQRVQDPGASDIGGLLSGSAACLAPWCCSVNSDHTQRWRVSPSADLVLLMTFTALNRQLGLASASASLVVMCKPG